ncbi:MAG: hypothetical protein AAF403_08515 [Pseudomonadota bacterium]
MLMLPTRKRPEKIKHFIQNAVERNTKHTIVIAVNQDDDSYDEIKLPTFMMMVKIPAHYKAAQAYHYIFELFPNEPWYGILADDIIIHTDHWDSHIATSVVKHHLVYCRTDVNKQDMRKDMGHYFLSNRLAHAIGGTNYPGFIHMGPEYYAFATGRVILGHYAYHKDIILEHINDERRSQDTTYAGARQYYPEDKSRWLLLRLSSYFVELCEVAKRRFLGEKIDLIPIPKELQREHFFEMALLPTYPTLPQNSQMRHVLDKLYPELKQLNR